MSWHNPESNKEWTSDGRFYVYVLQTINGHYVGHTGNLKERLKRHHQNKVESTKFSAPNLIWKSKPFKSRESAAKYEAALKSWRDSQSSSYARQTGFQPRPFIKASNKPYVQKSIGGKKFSGGKRARRSQPYIKRRRRYVK